MTSGRASTILAAIFLAAGAAWGGYLGWRHVRGDATILDRLEAPLADLRFLIGGPRRPPANLALVVIDDRTVVAVGRYPLPRARLADLVGQLSRAGAKLVAVDILFLDPGPPEGDIALAEALRKVPTVIGAAAFFGESGRTDGALPLSNGVPIADRVAWPLATFRKAAGVGLTNVVSDRSGTPRHVPMLVAFEKSLQPSFALRVAMASAAAAPTIADGAVRLGGTTTRLDIGAHLAVRFYGARGAIPTVSAADVLEGRTDPALLRNRIVFVGATATGAGDAFTTPFDQLMPGAEVLATAVGNLVTGDGLVRTADVRRIDAAVAVGLPAAMVFLLSLRRLGIGVALAVFLIFAWLAAVTIAFAWGVWLSIAVPVAAVIPTALSFGVARLLFDRHLRTQAQRAEAVLRRFQSPVLTDRLRTMPDYLAEPMAQPAAVVFVDLSGFTGLAEAQGAGETRALLRDFHRLVDEEITAEGGFVISYMGDGAMAVFGIPDPTPADAGAAVRAARALSIRTLAWLCDVRAGLPPEAPLGVKLGAHYGPVIVSRLGGETYQHITATGDTVNVASRLMAVAASRAATLAFSEDILAAAGIQDDAGFMATEKVVLRGRTEPLAVRLWSPP